MLINRNVAFDDKLNKRNLFLKKKFRENEIDTKVFEKKINVENNNTTLFLLICSIDDTLCFI